MTSMRNKAFSVSIGPFRDDDGDGVTLIEDSGALTLLGHVQREVPDLAFFHSLGPGGHALLGETIRYARCDFRDRIAVAEIDTNQRCALSSTLKVFAMASRAVGIELFDKAVAHRDLAELFPVDLGGVETLGEGIR